MKLSDANRVECVYRFLKHFGRGTQNDVAEFATHLSETMKIANALWPEEIEAYRHKPAREFMDFLDAKTGLTTDRSQPASFKYWLPKLRKLAA